MRGRPGSVNLCRVESCRPNLARSVPVEIPVWEEAVGLRRGNEMGNDEDLGWLCLFPN